MQKNLIRRDVELLRERPGQLHKPAHLHRRERLAPTIPDQADRDRVPVVPVGVLARGVSTGQLVQPPLPHIDLAILNPPPVPEHEVVSKPRQVEFVDVV